MATSARTDQTAGQPPIDLELLIEQVSHDYDLMMKSIREANAEMRRVENPTRPERIDTDEGRIAMLQHDVSRLSAVRAKMMAWRAATEKQIDALSAIKHNSVEDIMNDIEGPVTTESVRISINRAMALSGRQAHENMLELESRMESVLESLASRIARLQEHASTKEQVKT